MSSVCPTALFSNFVSANTFKGILATFNQICADLDLDPMDYPNFYARIRNKLNSWKAEKFWSLLDKRAAQKEYRNQTVGRNLKILIIGAGPCGLRMAIECALLGCKVVLLEKRERFSRNNVLHVWPFVIHDLRSLGGKQLYPRFCAGSIDHISIRQLQCILLKIALVLGVEIHENVAFVELVQAEQDANGTVYGWRANVDPPNHYVSDYEFDVLIGADGKRNTVPGFSRKEFRGKLAIAITANFINRRTEAEERVAEISGVAFIFNQQFFKDMREETKIDLENIVYYKDDTHYFVMTAKKPSLLEKNVLKKDYDDVGRLLSPSNICQDKLLAYAREAADFATEGALPRLDYALNHYGQPDVAMFDFTSLFSAEYSCRFVERLNKRLLVAIVGDSLHEPFWPTGSGCARGFLGVMDTAWMIRQYCGAAGPVTIGDILAERESAYRLLAQTMPENLAKNLQLYTIDPKSRYLRFELSILPAQVRSLADTDYSSIDSTLPCLMYSDGNSNRKRFLIENAKASTTQPPLVDSTNAMDASPYVRQQQLARWYQSLVAPYRIRIENLTTSFRSGAALLGVIRRYRPDLMTGWDDSMFDCKASDWQKVSGRALDMIREEYGIDPPISLNDKNCMFNYLSLLRNALLSSGEPLAIVNLSPSMRASPGRTSPLMSLRKNSGDRTSSTPYSTTGSNGHHGGQRSSPSIYAQETEEQRQERHRKRLQTLQKAHDLFAGGDESDKEKGSKYTRRPENVEKLADNRLQEFERLLMGKVQERKREVNQKKPTIKMRKLEQKEIDEMEEKLRITGMGCLLKVQPTLSSRESKVIAVKTHTLKEKAREGFKENAEKYEDFDRNLSGLNKRLNTPNLCGAVGVTDLLQKHKENITYMTPKKPPPPVPPKNGAVTPVPVISPTGDSGFSKQSLCHFCGLQVYLAEKMNVENLSCHRRCFRCAFCDSPLKLNGYGMERIEYGGYGKQFFCSQHLNLPLSDKISKINEKRRAAQRHVASTAEVKPTPVMPEADATMADGPVMKSTNREDDFRPANMSNNVESPENGPPDDVDLPTSASRDLLSSGRFHSHNTPERAEFEARYGVDENQSASPTSQTGQLELVTIQPPSSSLPTAAVCSDEELDEEEMLRHNITEVAVDTDADDQQQQADGQTTFELCPQTTIDRDSDSDSELSSGEEQALVELLDRTGGHLPSFDETVSLIHTLKTKRRDGSRENLLSDDLTNLPEVSVSLDIQHTTADAAVTPNRLAVDHLQVTPSLLTPDETSFYYTPAQTPAALFKQPEIPPPNDGGSARQRIMQDLNRQRAEARARARLKSDEELGLSPGYFQVSSAQFRSSPAHETVPKTKSHESLHCISAPEKPSEKLRSVSIDVAVPLRKTLSQELKLPASVPTLDGGTGPVDRPGDKKQPAAAPSLTATPVSSTEAPKKPQSFFTRLLRSFSPPTVPVAEANETTSMSASTTKVSCESGKETSLLGKIGWKYGSNKRRSKGSLSPQQSFEKSTPPTEDVLKTFEDISPMHTAPKATAEETDLDDIDVDTSDGKYSKYVDSNQLADENEAILSFSTESLLSNESNVSDREVRRLQRAAAKLMKQEQAKRHRQAGEVQRQMEQVEVKRSELNEEGGELEKRLQKNPKERSNLKRWLTLVEEREQLSRFESELMLKIREMELENRHNQLQQLYRERLLMPSSTKTSKDLREEQQLLEQMLYVVSQRDALVSNMEKQRRDAQKLEMSTEQMDRLLKNKSYDFRNFNAVFTLPKRSNVPVVNLPVIMTANNDERLYSAALDSVI